MTTPRDAGFRVPFEGDPHSATWVGWPAHADLWQDRLAAVRAEVAALCHAIAAPPAHGPAERLEVAVLDADAEDSARAALAGLPARYHRVLYGDIWLRDTLPVFLADPLGRVGSVRFRFDGWGGKYSLPGDAELATRVQAIDGRRAFATDIVLEGGSVEADGEGTLLTTRQCLLDGVRNPGWTEDDATRALCDAYGASRVIWLDEGLLNDHTDGHIDTLARFVAPGVVACMVPSGPDDPNTRVLRDIRAALAGAVDARGRRLDVIDVPSPGRVVGDDGRVLPASHVNFLIANHAVIVPTYGTPTGEAAVKALAPWFPRRAVIGRSARGLLEGGGAFHCITQQVPAEGGLP